MIGRRAVQQRLESIEKRIGSIGSAVDKVEAALVVRDPGNARSVEAYDGLRRQVAAAAGDRRRLLVLLTGLADAVQRGATGEDLANLLEEACLQASAVRVVDPESHGIYDVVDGEGSAVEVLSPAWVDGLTGALIRAGTARRVHPVPEPSEPPERQQGPADGVPGATDPDSDSAVESEAESQTGDPSADVGSPAAEGRPLDAEPAETQEDAEIPTGSQDDDGPQSPEDEGERSV